MKKWLAVIGFAASLGVVVAGTWSAALEPWVYGMMAVLVFSVSYGTNLFVGWWVERQLFTYFMMQGYSEEAADREIAVFEKITPDRWAKRRDGVRRREREEYERLRKKFEE